MGAESAQYISAPLSGCVQHFHIGGRVSTADGTLSGTIEGWETSGWREPQIYFVDAEGAAHSISAHKLVVHEIPHSIRAESDNRSAVSPFHLRDYDDEWLSGPYFSLVTASAAADAWEIENTPRICHICNAYSNSVS